MEKTRIEIFEEAIKDSPTDAFANYALAMEYEKAGQFEAGLSQYQKIIGFDPDYVPAYQMCGQLLLRLGRSKEAREVLTQGLDASRRTGNAKATNEIQGLLDELRV